MVHHAVRAGRRSRLTARPRRGAASALGIAAIVAASAIALADSAIDSASLLPKDAGVQVNYDGKRYYSATVGTGTVAYVFGGNHDNFKAWKDVVKYDPATDAATLTGASLPAGRQFHASVWTGSVAYVLGGVEASTNQPLASVLKYDPVANVVSSQGALDATWHDGSAAWSTAEGCAYLFGGHVANVASNEIRRYCPATSTTTVKSAALPGPFLVSTSATWDGRFFYVFGGTNGGYVDDVVRYDPVDDSVTVASGVLPAPSKWSSAATSGHCSYVFGGYDGANIHGWIAIYNPRADAVTTSAVELPFVTAIENGRYGSSAAWASGKALVFGGWTGNSQTDKIVRVTIDSVADADCEFDLPTAPQNLAASAGPGGGEITLTWSPPASTGGLPVVSYRIYRGIAPGSTTFLTDVGAVSTFTDAGLGNAATRYYRVAAVTALGEGAASGEVGATTFDVPSATRDLAAAAGPGAGEITLTWSAPASNGGAAITAYEIHRGDASGAQTLLTTVGNVLTFTDAGLGNGITKFYAVRARNAAGAGAFSGESSATTGVSPSAPRNLTATTELDFQHVDLAWEPPVDDGRLARAKYVLYRTKAAVGGTTAIDVPAGATSYRDLPPSFGVYEYAIAAVNPAGEGPISNEECAVGGRITSESPAYVQAMMASGCPAT